MAKNTADYWRRRAERIINEEAKSDKEVMERVREITSTMIQDIEKEILAFYAKYATKEGISLEEAKKKIDATDIREFEDRVKTYVKNQDFSDEANKLLRQYNTKMYVSREQLLKRQLEVIMVNGTGKLEKEFYEYLDDATQREIKRQSGVLGAAVQLRPELVRAIVNSDFQGAKWSERLWSNMDATRKEVERTAAHALTRGRHPREFVPQLKKKLGVSTYAANRLLITETARVQSEAQKLHYQETLGDEAEVEYIAKLDDRTSKTCRHLDGSKIKVKDIVIGVNFPPMHPHCRSTTAPAVSDWRDEFFKKRKGKYSLDKFVEEEPEEEQQQEQSSTEIIFNDNLRAAFGDEQIAELQRKLNYNKDTEGFQDYAKIWNYFKDDMIVERLPANKGAHYKPFNQHVYMNFDNLGERDQIKTSNGMREGDDNYSTVIHEFSHMIDFAIMKELKGAKNTVYGAYSSTGEHYEEDAKGKPKTLADVIKAEIDAKAREEVKRLKKAHKEGDFSVWHGYSTPKLADGRQALVNKYREQYHLGHSSGLSDMIEAATNGSHRIAYGHGKGYWKKHPVTKLPVAANLEAFAEFSEMFIDENKREVLSKELPNAYALYLKMLKEIAEAIGI
ncbi:minor capsid protein [Mammaliicoccus sciuri]|uniref:minor capsid protein n=1 Tax=Mammaliicoccus sciuri TaxID=1296 RepID=UPI001F30A6B8|nr:minor capsid protein [Mammaliicoccus sciuri]MCE5058180.1 minor capsid protein [Mammaliicoccus sciuri]